MYHEVSPFLFNDYNSEKNYSDAELKQEQQYKQVIDEIRDRRSKYYSHL